jgi:hypothetical protein
MGRNGPINCQAHFTIPAGTAPGIYAVYWVWNFPKTPASVDPNYSEVYTSCMDVEVSANGAPAAAASSPGSQPSPAAKGKDIAPNDGPHNATVTTVTHTHRHTRVHKFLKTTTMDFGRGGNQALATETANPDVGVKVRRRQKWVTIYQ